ncbi:hypothetical protein GCM10009730_60430 [Streptomyces albidochromogenes]
MAIRIRELLIVVARKLAAEPLPLPFRCGRVHGSIPGSQYASPMEPHPRLSLPPPSPSRTLSPNPVPFPLPLPPEMPT